MTTEQTTTRPAAWIQPTSGMIHRKPNCSVARRSRSGLATLTAEQLAERPDNPRCKRCYPDLPKYVASFSEHTGMYAVIDRATGVIVRDGIEARQDAEWVARFKSDDEFAQRAVNAYSQGC